MKKSFFTYLLLSFVSVLTYGQYYESYPVYQQQTETLSAKEKIKRIQFNTNIGSSFFYAQGFGSGTEFFAAPELSYGLTPKLSIHGGMMFSYTGFFGLGFGLGCGVTSGFGSTRGFCSVRGGACFGGEMDAARGSSGNRDLNA